MGRTDTGLTRTVSVANNNDNLYRGRVGIGTTGYNAFSDTTTLFECKGTGVIDTANITQANVGNIKAKSLYSFKQPTGNMISLVNTATYTSPIKAYLLANGYSYGLYSFHARAFTTLGVPNYNYYTVGNFLFLNDTIVNTSIIYSTDVGIPGGAIDISVSIIAGDIAFTNNTGGTIGLDIVVSPVVSRLPTNDNIYP